MEPEEGKYAWLYNENYKKLIQGALNRGLKLCFRIYNNSQDNIRQSTPEYVRKAGAKGYMAKGYNQDLWTPYPDDSIFLSKLEKFVSAFAKEYDNPDIVDFVDGCNIGYWGECHNIRLQNSQNLEYVFDRITSIYSSNFKKILLILPFQSQIGFDIEKRIAIDNKGYGIRRDGLGSMWFTEEERKITKKMFGKTLFIGESCWWKSSSDSIRPFINDKVYKLKTWRDVYELTYNHAISSGFNTLDLREIPETTGWTNKAIDLVKAFISKGGYRLYPSTINIPIALKRKDNVFIEHTWQNLGTGYLPNNLKNWSYKYKPAFALLNEKNEVVKIFIDKKAEPSQWIYTKPHTYKLPINLEDIPIGTYKWAVSIVDRKKENTPSLKLALNSPNIINGWYIISTLSLYE